MTRLFLAFLLLGLVFIFSVHTLTSVNQDIGRHLTLGKIIWETKSVPKTNLFSYTNPDFPFSNHHWLGEVFLYLGSIALGLKGLIVLKALVISLAFTLVFLAGYKKEQGFFAIILGLAAIFILIERTDVRPEIFSFLFFGWYLFVLFREKSLIWSLPFVQLLWVNTHIYFFLGPLVFLLFFIGEIVKPSQLRPQNIKHLVLSGLIIGLVNLVNPFLWQGALYPLFVFKNYGYSILENQSPFFLKSWGYPGLTTYALFAGILIAAASFLFNIRNFRKNIFGFLLMALVTILSLKMIRNYPLFAFGMLPVSFKNYSERLSKIEYKLDKFAAVGLILGVFLLVLIFSVIKNQIYERAGLNRHFGLIIPSGAQAAVDFVKQSGLRGPMFNNFDVGSFLIWKMEGEKVFIDGRPEAYPAEFIKEVYIPMQEDPEKWVFYAEKYNIQYVFWLYSDITPWSQRFVRFMLQNPDWPLIYRDGSVMIFAPTPTGFKAI